MATFVDRDNQAFAVVILLSELLEAEEEEIRGKERKRGKCEEVMPRQRMVDHVSEAMHALSHCYHNISDIIYELGPPPPRNLMAQRLPIYQSGPQPQNIVINAQPRSASVSAGSAAPAPDSVRESTLEEMGAPAPGEDPYVFVEVGPDSVTVNSISTHVVMSDDGGDMDEDLADLGVRQGQPVQVNVVPVPAGPMPAMGVMGPATINITHHRAAAPSGSTSNASSSGATATATSHVFHNRLVQHQHKYTIQASLRYSAIWCPFYCPGDPGAIAPGNIGNMMAGLLTDAFLCVAQHLTFTDLFNIFLGQTQPLSRLRQPLSRFVRENILNGAEVTEANLRSATERLVEEMMPDIRSSLTGVRVRPDVDLDATMRNFFSHHMMACFKFITDSNVGDEQFGSQLYRDLRRILGEFVVLTPMCLHEGQSAFSVMLQNRLEWVPVIEADVQRQKTQRPPAPLSDAYLQGMPPKRRRLMSYESGMSNMASYLPDALRQAAGQAGVEPISSPENLAAEAAHEEELHSMLEVEVQRSLTDRLERDDDYNAERIMNISSTLVICH
nr:hypothetical protein BaRGS_003400 [Batillaria attramentaria]